MLSKFNPKGKNEAASKTKQVRTINQNDFSKPFKAKIKTAATSIKLKVLSGQGKLLIKESSTTDKPKNRKRFTNI